MNLHLDQIKEINKMTLDNLLERTKKIEENLGQITQDLKANVSEISKQVQKEKQDSKKELEKEKQEVQSSISDFLKQLKIESQKTGTEEIGRKMDEVQAKINNTDKFLQNLKELLSYIEPSDFSRKN
jgi:23S rRNA pseudoU1915 N3-methylase RlmH